MMRSYEIKRISPAVNKTNQKIGPKILVNPYYGCEHQCLFCPANDGFLKRKAFDDFREKGVIHVVENIIDHVDNYILNNDHAEVIHLSPVSDPFQPVEAELQLSRRIIKHAADINMPVAICTKGSVPGELYPLIKKHPHSFVQISILTINEDKRKMLVRGSGASVEELLNGIQAMSDYGIRIIARIDPIFPYITDDMVEFEALVDELKKRKVRYIVSSVADIIEGALDRERGYLEAIQPGLSEKYTNLYTEKINGRIHANTEYRENIFFKLKGICESKGLEFGITWEPDINGNSINHKYSHRISNTL